MGSSPLTLLAVHAHPDDEAFSMGGTLAKLATAGVRTVIVCGTRGEAGEIHDPDLDPEEAKARLGDIREQELRRACQILAVRELRFLGYRDSGMAGTAENADPRNFHNADREEATGKVVRMLREFRPQVVVTYDPRGSYGHPDHIAAHQVTVAAIAAAADVGRYADQSLPAWQVAKLYYTAWPRSAFQRMREEMERRGVPLPFGNSDWNPDDFTTPDDQVTARVDVRQFLAQKRDALRVHRTQVGVDNFMLTLPDDVARDAFGDEAYSRVLSTVAAPEKEDDLFAGIR